MLTPAHCDLAFTLTKYYFDEQVAVILKTLFNFDQISLRFLRQALPDIKFNQLKKSLLTLVKYQLVDFVSSYKNGIELIEYSVVPQRVFSFYRFPKYIQKVNQNGEGSISALILIVLAEKALIGKEQLVKLTVDRIKTTSSEAFDEIEITKKVSDNLESLIARGYLVFYKDICIKIEKFDTDHKYDLIVDIICDYYQNDSKIRSLCRTMVDLTRDNTGNEASVTAPIPLAEISSKLVPGEFESRGSLESYLDKLSREENNRFFVACGKHENKGLMYAVNVGLAIDYLVKENLSSMIQTRFGPKCCRVFRVLLQKGPLLLKQIEEIIMLPARDVREYSYMLIKEGYIRNRQVPKTLDNAPGKSVFIMSVELDQVVYCATDLCCRTINNLLVRYKYELDRNKSLLDRSKAVQELLGSSDFKDNDASSLEEWSQYFNSHELADLNQIYRNLDKLLKAKMQVDENLFLFHKWLEIKSSLEVEESI